MRIWFSKAANRVSELTGSSWAFVAAATIVVVWAITGPLFQFSDTWQLVINTGTTIVTFLMVFLIQNTQNRDQRALHLKLDELLRAVEGAREHQFADLETKDDEELKQVRTALLEECGVCQDQEEHRHHGEPDWLKRHRDAVAAHAA